MLTLRLDFVGLFGHAPPTPKNPRKYGLASGGVSSPPRVLGNRAYAVLVYGDYRSIPARAGEPQMTKAVNRGQVVYPRACGGTFGLEGLDSSDDGLSPRVRGNLLATGQDEGGG